MDDFMAVQSPSTYAISRAGKSIEYAVRHSSASSPAGVDLAGTVVELGPGVKEFSIGERVFAMADNAYAQLCFVKVAVQAKVPEGLNLIQAAALPLVMVTGSQLLAATGIKAGQTVLVVGAAGNVGRSAVFTAKDRGATVIAGILNRQMAYMAAAVRDVRLVIPISEELTLRDGAMAQAQAEKGGVGKILLVV